MDRQRVFKIIRYGFLALGGSLAAVAAAWYLLNLTHEPAYGDTVEYWALSRSLEIDPWRTLAYPLLLRLVDAGSGIINPRVPLYLLQTAVSLAAAAYFFETLFLYVLKGRERLLLYRISLPVLFIALPLVAHFNLSVLTDSLGVSFFLSGFAALIRIFIMRKPTVPAVAVAAVSIFAAGFIRPERVMQFIAIIVVAAAFVVFRKRYRLLLAALLLVVVALGTQMFNTATQDADVGRPRPTLTYALFDRVLQGRFLAIYDEMPENVQAAITREDAELWAANGHYVANLGKRLDTPEGHVIMRDAIRAALGCCGGPIIYQATVDQVEYLLTPLNYLRESLFETDEMTSWTAWTDTRMAAAHETLTYAYINLGFVVIAAAFILFVTGLPALWRSVAVRELMVFSGAVVFLTSTMYMIRTGIDFHIRYALPIYALEVGLFLWGATLIVESRAAGDS